MAVQFFHSDCGHIVGTTGTQADLTAAQIDRATRGFESDLAKVLETGTFVWRSSRSYDSEAKHALSVIAQEWPSVTPESIEYAITAHQRWLDWFQAD